MSYLNIGNREDQTNVSVGTYTKSNNQQIRKVVY